MPFSRLRSSRLLRAALLAVATLAPGLVHAQAEPALLSPAWRTPAFAKAAPTGREVMRQRPVEIQTAPLAEKAGKGGASFSIELFDGETVLVDTLHVEHRGPDDYTYFGKVRGQADSEVVLTFVDGHLHAEILPGTLRARGKAYRVESRGESGHWLQELDPGAFPPDHADGEEGFEPPRLDKLVQGKATAEDLQKDTASTIDLLVVYSAKAGATAGTAIGSQIQAAVDKANLAYANSGVGTRLRLVHKAATSYVESGSFSTDLSRLANASDGYVDNVHTLRNTYGADLVSLFIESSASCGIAYIGPSSTAVFSVVARNCASSNLSLAHELAHNFGARHDPYVDASTTPYAYGHGHVNVSGRWRTVMAYNNKCSAAGVSCTRVAYFSNPNVSYNGAPTGTVESGTTPTSNNVRVHNNNAYTVANYRTAVSSVAPTCTFTLSPSTASVATAGGTGSTTVTGTSGCAWNASSTASWLTVGAGSGTSGSGTLNYAATANSGPARSATINVGTASLTVSQSSGCTYTVSPTSASVGAAGGTYTVSVTTGAGCTWSAASALSWLTVSASGTGSGSVSYSVASNTGAMRTGNLTVAGRTVTVTQAAPAATTSVELTPTSMDFGPLQVGKVSGQITAVYRNSGTLAVTIGALSVGGANPEDFPASSTCKVGQVLNAGQSCTLAFSFAPKGSGARTAAASVTSGAGTHRIALAGDGKGRKN